tara:strand:- start:145 stop:444 length:300 start_codon:yes stop_codon:yes gene_type:complete
MNKQIIYQEQVFSNYIKQQKLFIQNMRNCNITPISINLINRFNDQIIDLTNDLTEINEYFITNTTNKDIEQKIRNYQQVNRQIKQLLPFIIQETIQETI